MHLYIIIYIFFVVNLCFKVLLILMVNSSICLEAPTNFESKSPNLERTFAIDTTIYILNRLFQDVPRCVRSELVSVNFKFSISLSYILPGFTFLYMQKLYFLLFDLEWKCLLQIQKIIKSMVL